MRKRILQAVVTVGSVISLAAGVATAGDWHTGSTLICMDCHTMHASQQHGYSADGTDTFAPIGAAGPYEFLLRNDVNDLCLSCHDNKPFAPDVFEANSNSYVRQAGGLNDGTGATYHDVNGHTLGSTATAPGGAFTSAHGLSCVDCHSPHGRATSGTAGANGYRNLYSAGTENPTVGSGASISYARGDVDGPNTGANLTRWIFEDFSGPTPGVTLASHYGYDRVTFNEPTTTKSAYADFCKTCHANFHGDVTGAEIGGVVAGAGWEEFKRHPASTVNIGAIGGGHSSLARFAGTNPVVANRNQVHVMSPTGVRAGSYGIANTDLSPSCMSCHKGHGNQNAFGLIYMLGSGTITEEGDNGVDARNMCRQCHGMGGSSTAW